MSLNVVIKEDIGNTIKWANQKWNVNLDPENFKIEKDGSITVNPELLKKYGALKIKVLNGKLVLDDKDSKELSSLLLSDLVDPKSLVGKVSVETSNPISGDGKTGNSLKLNLKSSDFAVTEDGKLAFSQNIAELLTHLSTTCFVECNQMGKGLSFDQEKHKWVVNAKDADGIKVNPDGTIGLSLSQDEGNKLEMRNDGVYYGLIAPQDVRNQYVDAVNGNDDNAGTKAAPLRTIAKALSRIPEGSINNTVYIKESQTHNFNASERQGINYGVTIHPYGDNLDRLNNEWNATATGWEATASESWDAYRPTIMINPNFSLPAFGGKTSPNAFELFNGNELVFNGVAFSVADNPNVVTGKEWRSIVRGNGTVEFQNVLANNANSNGNWQLAGTLARPLSVIGRPLLANNLNSSNYMFYSDGSKLDIVQYGRNNDVNPHSSTNMKWKQAPSMSELKSLIIPEQQGLVSSALITTN